MKRIGLLGGSFNPAHAGHLRISLAAMRQLGLDEVWWLVSPQNPLKTAAGMAPLAARLASARIAARHPRIQVSALEADLGTRYTVDTVGALVKLYPTHRFVWLMGADILSQLHRWRRWRDFARAVPIAVFPRPGYSSVGLGAPAMAWLGRWRRSSGRARDWTRWTLPAIVMLDIKLDSHSATAIREREPDWAARLLNRS
ncbi:nicotinate-nucleotide adenylyltransferase [Glacieibacterium sp.]|uniref:nicotinate-nucleotide adenylyltransferase n=1 Tax=Glacieibacterium sp. TaxID=2860237 RepID=UPI003B00035E